MGTVVGIIDGTGSLGAAFGQLIVKYFYLTYSLDWNNCLKLKLELRICHDVFHDTYKLLAPNQTV
jgi:hypothetical protein